MTTTTPTETAIAAQDDRTTVLVPRYQDEFANALPSHVKPGNFVQMAVSALRRDDYLRNAADLNPASLIHALRDAARLGLMPGTEQYWLTARPDRNATGGMTVLGMPGYEGEIELMYRAGAVESVIAEAVYEDDGWEYVVGTHPRPIHTVDWFGDRGALKGSYAYAVMRGGATSKVVVCGQERIARAKSASSTADKNRSPWKSDPAAMYIKTAVHDLAKFVPTSAEYIREQLRAVADVQAEQADRPIAAVIPAPPDLPAHNPDTGELADETASDQGDDVVDGHVVEDPPEDPWESTPPVRQPPAP